ncbi:hypothetical protein BDV38DRAFT_66623 [Aspergillus pseudotamarii]|uniref:Uncharacterized protein n=1 Tax=Aspergillus pseudotamarii TaxID=132259 RepID=A0A5N6TAM3_ASPPS|nr:uncharacterized protein BDV38DRAFT_66623 [Aspergillus pseudotamarii]KAE8143383.1 hypothetical protein BDV38DRAFT_66623 [Aspergillus pseudotamarii]
MPPIPTLLQHYHRHRQDQDQDQDQDLTNADNHLTKRLTPIPLGPAYNTISIPASYGRLDTSPSPGTVAGIILGSVFGFIFLLYLLWLGLSSGRRFGSETQTEMASASSAGGMRRRRGRRIVVEEERPASAHSHGHGHGDHIIVEESVTSAPSRSEGDVIEVFEEASSVDRPPRRGKHNGGGGWRRGDLEGSEFSSRI